MSNNPPTSESDSNCQDVPGKILGPLSDSHFATDAEAKEYKSIWRPANILTWSLTNSPRLIGWDDDKFRALIEEHRRRRKEDPSIPNAEETGFGLMNILVKNVKEALYKNTAFNDLKSDLKILEGKEGKNGKEDKDSIILSERVSVPSSSIEIIGTKVNVREMKAYKNVLSSIKYQRDAYIMGEDYASVRKGQRETESKTQSKNYLVDDSDNDHVQSHDHPSYHGYLNKTPTVDTKSQGTKQLSGLLSWFIPSRTLHKALLPTALWTISPPSKSVPEGGPLRWRINRSVCALIPLSQNLLDRTMKNSILYVLSDSNMRDSVKGSSRTYLGGNILGTQHTSGGKFVTTKTVRI